MDEIRSTIKSLITHFFNSFGIKHATYKNEGELLSSYFNFRLRYIGIEKREIRISKELGSTLNAHKYCDACFDIFSKCIHGADLNPYQSKALSNADYNDLLFNDWRIHHLHLGNQKEKSNSYFYNRTGPLLFVMFTQSTAYFICFQSHNDDSPWSNTTLLRIIQSNWPNLLKDKEMPGCKIYPELTDEQLGTLRKKGYITGVNVDEKAYLLVGDGISSTGRNMSANLLSDRVLRWSFENRELFQQNKEQFLLYLKEMLYIG